MRKKVEFRLFWDCMYAAGLSSLAIEEDRLRQLYAIVIGLMMNEKLNAGLLFEPLSSI